MEVILIGNEKGGCGKTTTTLLLTNCLTALGYRVLAADFDPSGNLSQAALPKIPDRVLYDVLTGQAELYETIVKTPYGDFLPTKRDNTAKPEAATQTANGFPTFVPVQRKSLTDLFSKISGQPNWTKLVGAMLWSTGLDQQYDYIFLDSCPSDGPIITNCLVAADYVILPLEADNSTVNGMKMLITSALDASGNAKLDGIVLSKFDVEWAVDKTILNDIQDMAKSLSIPIYDTRVRLSAPIKTAMSQSRPITDFPNNGHGMADAMNLALEFLRKRGLEPKKVAPGVVKDETGRYIYRKNGDYFYEVVGENHCLMLCRKFHSSMTQNEDFQNNVGKTVFFGFEEASHAFPNAKLVKE